MVSVPTPGGVIPQKKETLHAQPEPDRFAHESPIRAFTDWNVSGKYAIGKGFRPSLAHLPVYLDALDAKEGWSLLQILEAATGSPSFVFRRVPTALVEPDETGWIDAGGPAIPGDTLVEVEMMSGERLGPLAASMFDWNGEGLWPSYNIVRYRIVG